MMLYHGCWDLVNLFGIQADWYYGLPGHLWQQSICWVFILLSGFCVQLGHHTLRRGAQVFGAGAAVCYMNIQRSATLQVARLRISVPTLSFIWMPAKPSAKAACTFSSLSSINMHSLAFS